MRIFAKLRETALTFSNPVARSILPIRTSMVHLQGISALTTLSDPSQRISWQLTRRKSRPASLALENGSEDEYRFRILTSKFSHPPRILGDSNHPKIRKPESSQQSPNDLLMSTSSPSSNEAKINRHLFKRAMTS